MSSGRKGSSQNEILSRIEIRLHAIYMILFRMMARSYQWDGTKTDRKVVEMILHLDAVAKRMQQDQGYPDFDAFAGDGPRWHLRLWIRIRHFFRMTWPMWLSISSLIVAVAILWRAW